MVIICILHHGHTLDTSTWHMYHGSHFGLISNVISRFGHLSNMTYLSRVTLWTSPTWRIYHGSPLGTSKTWHTYHGHTLDTSPTWRIYHASYLHGISITGHIFTYLQTTYLSRFTLWTYLQRDITDHALGTTPTWHIYHRSRFGRLQHDVSITGHISMAYLSLFTLWTHLKHYISAANENRIVLF
jgi:hypothetical protein